MWAKAASILANYQVRRQTRGALLFGVFVSYELLQYPHGATVIGCAGVLAGTLLNQLVVAVNGGFMPVACTKELIPVRLRGHYKAIDNESRLVVLSDRLPLGRRRLASFGDILIFIGSVILLLIQLAAQKY